MLSGFHTFLGNVSNFGVITMCCSRKYPYPSHGRFLNLKPPPLRKCHYNVILSFKKIGLLKAPSPLEFLLTFLGVGMDIFWNHAIHSGIQATLRFLVLISMKHNFFVQACHVPGVSNEIADALLHFQDAPFQAGAPNAEQTPCTIPPLLMTL